MSDFDRINREIQERQIRIQQDIIQKQREAEEKHMKHMQEVQRKQQEIQERIHQNNQNMYGTNPYPNLNINTNTNNASNVPSMEWTPVNPNNPSHQYFINK